MVVAQEQAAAARVADVRARCGSGLAADVASSYWTGLAADDVVAREPGDLHGALTSHLALGRHRAAGTPLVRVYTPNPVDDGWQSPHSVLDCVTDDMPFLVDSVTMAVAAAGADVHLLLHPVLDVRRDEHGELAAVDGGQGESWIHLEIDRVAADDAESLRQAVLVALDDVRRVVDDWQAMRERCLAIADELDGEAAALLRWMAEDHFTFIAYREYELDGDRITSMEGTGLGVLRGAGPSTHLLADLPPEGAAKVRDPASVLQITTTNRDASVHRPTPMDYVGVKLVDPTTGRLRERRFLGLWTSPVIRMSVFDLPVVRQTVRAVLDRAGFASGGHDGNRLVDVLEGFPRSELFEIDVDDLLETALGIVHLRERPQVRLFVRQDAYGRFVSCLVYVPRDRFSTDVRIQIQDVLLEAFGGTHLRFSTELGSDSHGRLHLVISTPSTAPRHTDLRALEARITTLTRRWVDDLAEAVHDRVGGEDADRLLLRWKDAFPVAYQDEVDAAVAIDDLRRIEALGDDDLAVLVQQRAGADDRELRCKLYRSGSPISLTTALPLLKDLGVTVLDERPYELARDGAIAAWIYDFGLLLPDDARLGADARRAFEDAFLAVWRGHADSDALGALVLRAGLTWPQVALIRTYRQYLRQAGSPFSQGYLDETLTANAGVAAMLVELFEARFDPEHHDLEHASAIAGRVEEALTLVTSLDEDRIIRSFLAAVQATVRTSWYRADRDPSVVVLKLDPRAVPDLPSPRPAHEVFVHSPRMEGVHLRMGRVARGGLRSSDRREDFRTEVLGLVKAQTVKNAVIVPVGAKGGFVCRALPGDPTAARAEVVAAYRTFVGALLDVTDDLVDGTAVGPPGVVRHDGDDAYLVVAADKGTATFSDIANAIAIARGFWLGDAFASGGSDGYDHKAIGITAKGAWESVRRHFRHLGIDADTEHITAVGIGDMSGDVFGNGMLLSSHLRLVAAFDHRHVFVDPSPDAARSFDERQRLFTLPASSWADFDPAVISVGGGVFARSAKSVEVSPEMAWALDVEPGPMRPNDLVQAVLRAPVDLLWNGGIGTYVKASSEDHDDAADRANDAVRVDAGELRCRVVAEGGNLGLTQRGRIELAQRGVLVNTDAIDNSAGVDCSDHEVNLKILLDRIVRDGDLTTEQRNALLVQMTAEVSDLVLADNRDQNLALAAARTQAPSMVDVHIRHLTWLERAAGLDRALELLPSDDELIERAGRREGLTQPELAVLLAYTKIVLARELLHSDLPDDEAFADELAAYFPNPIRVRFGDRLASHPLRRELIATQVTNRLVNRAGISMVHRMEEETSAAAADIARAHVAAWEVFGLGALWEDVQALERTVDADTQVRCLLEVRKLGERATRWFIQNRAMPLDVAAAVAAIRPQVDDVVTVLPLALRSLSDRPDIDERARLVAAGVPTALAGSIALLPLVITALDIGDLASRDGRPVGQVADAYYRIDEQLGLGWLRSRITQLPRDDAWQALARTALRDDFFAEHKRLTDHALRVAGAGTDAAVVVDKWLAEHRALLDRCLRVLAELRGTPSPGLAQLSVALRELRNVAHQTRG